MEWITPIQEMESQAQQLKSLFEEADAIVVGIGAGMSAADGFTYIGERFESAFPDFIGQLGRVLVFSKSFYCTELLRSTSGSSLCRVERNA